MSVIMFKVKKKHHKHKKLMNNLFPLKGTILGNIKYITDISFFFFTCGNVCQPASWLQNMK